MNGAELADRKLRPGAPDEYPVTGLEHHAAIQDSHPDDQMKDIIALLLGSGFIFGCRLFGAVAAFTTQMLLARWMGAAELGVFVLAFSWMILLATAASVGFPASAIRFIGEGLTKGDHRIVRGFIRRGNYQLIALSVLFWLLAALVIWSGLIVETQYGTEFLIAFAAVPTYAIILFNNSVANAFSWFKLSFLPNDVIRPVLFLLTIALAWSAGVPLSALTVLEINWVVILAVAFGVYLLTRWAKNTSLDPGPLVYHGVLWLRTSIPLLAITYFTYFFPDVMIILIAWFVPADDLAVFNVCFRVALLVGFGLNAIDAFIGPKIVAMNTAGDKTGLQRIVNLATFLRFAGAITGVAFLAITGRWLLALFGDEFVAGYTVLLVLAGAQIVRAGVGPVTTLLSMSGYHNPTLMVCGVALAIAFVLVLILVPFYGILGAAIAALATILIWCVWLWVLVRRYMGITPSVVPSL